MNPSRFNRSLLLCIRLGTRFVFKTTFRLKFHRYLNRVLKTKRKCVHDRACAKLITQQRKYVCILLLDYEGNPLYNINIAIFVSFS